MKSVSLHTLGCKLNYSETSTIAKQFEQNGYSLKRFGERSDVFVLNTCSVTENADRECRQVVRSVLRKNPETYVIITGCYAQLQPDEIASIDGVDVVLGAAEKFRLFEYIDSFEKKELSCIFREPVDKISNFDVAFSADNDSRTRAFLKIQDGCNYKCTFCTIPLARGVSRSLEISRMVDIAKQIIDSGYKEIILTGVNTGDYAFQNNGKIFKLIDVLYELDKLDIPRIRISSIEPNLLNDEIISLISSSEKFCNHFHIPLQSGDPDILKRMKRRYTASYYKELVFKLTEQVPDVGIGVDVITGFPGEQEDNFISTVEFLESLPVAYLHVFTYSERRDTPAAALPGRVDIAERRRRTGELRKISDDKRNKFYKKFEGTTQNVLFESANENGMINGYTTNYIRVTGSTDDFAENNISEVTLGEVKGVEPVSCFADGVLSKI